MSKYTPQDIRSERIKRKWTQRAFADMIGVTPVSVSKWENGQTEPSYNHMRRISEVFDHGADRDRVAELEADVEALRTQQRELVARLNELLQEAREYRAETHAMFERLATRSADAGDAARPSRPEVGQ